MSTVGEDTCDAGPCDAEAERACLAALLLDGDGRDGVAARLAVEVRASDFGDPVRAELWSAAVEALRRGPLDVVSLAAELRARGKFNTVGGAAAIGALTDDIVSLAPADVWASIVRRDARARRVIAAALPRHWPARSAAGS